MTRGRRAIIAEDEGRLVAKHQDVVVEEEKEEEKEEEDDQLMKGPIIVEKTEINKEKQKQKHNTTISVTENIACEVNPMPQCHTYQSMSLSCDGSPEQMAISQNTNTHRE